MSDSNDQPSEGELIFYQTFEGAVRVEVLYELETFWMNQKRIAELFGVEIHTVSYHMKEIYASGELTPEATLRKVRRVQTERFGRASDGSTSRLLTSTSNAVSTTMIPQKSPRLFSKPYRTSCIGL